MPLVVLESLMGTDERVQRAMANIGRRRRYVKHLRIFRAKIAAGDTWWCGGPTQAIVDQIEKDRTELEAEMRHTAAEHPAIARAAMKLVQEEGMPYDYS